MVTPPSLIPHGVPLKCFYIGGAPESQRPPRAEIIAFHLLTMNL